MNSIAVLVALVAGLGGATGASSILTYRHLVKKDQLKESADVIRARSEAEEAKATRLDNGSYRLIGSLEKRIDLLDKEVARCEQANNERDDLIDKLRDEVRALQAGQQAILDTIHDGVVLVNPAGRITFANRALLQMIGWSSIDLIGEPIHSLVPVIKREEHKENVVNYLKHPTPRRMGAGLKLVIVHKDGSEIPVHISLSPQGSGEVLAIVHAST